MHHLSNNALRRERPLPQRRDLKDQAGLAFIRARMEVLKTVLKDASEVFATEVLNSIGPLDLELLESLDLDGGVDFYELVRDFEISLIRRALYRCGGSQRRAAILLSIKATTLNSKMKTYGISVKAVDKTTKVRAPI
jgi:DNA-binding NtrC family response regulator